MTKQNLLSIFLFAIFTHFTFCSPCIVYAEDFHKSVILLEGTSLQQEIPYSDVCNLCSDNKGIAQVTAEGFYIIFHATFPGTTVVQFDSFDQTDHYTYEVTVLSKSETCTAAENAYNDYLSNCKTGTKYTTTDLNHDGLKELYFKDKIVFYNYQTNQLTTKKHTFKKLYTCKKNSLLFAEQRNPRTTKEFVYNYAFYEFNPTKIFSFQKNGKGFRSYTRIGKLNYHVQKDYAYYDTGYDQDDYEYKAYTKKQVQKKITKRMPGYKEVKCNKRVKE